MTGITKGVSSFTFLETMVLAITMVFDGIRILFIPLDNVQDEGVTQLLHQFVNHTLENKTMKR